jgi:hypothetical protein
MQIRKLFGDRGLINLHDRSVRRQRMLNVGSIEILRHRRLIDSLRLRGRCFLLRDWMDWSIRRGIIVPHAWR